jgi:thioredoxin 1
MVDLTAATWDHVVAGDRPVLVQFWAPWCGPCRALHPTFLDLARHFDRRATFARLNVDEEMDICVRYDIAVIPTLLLFRRGHIESQLTGVPAAVVLARMLHRVVE